MSNKVSVLVYSRKVGSPIRKAVLVYFAERASDNGAGIWASKTSIANAIECGRSTVIRTINDFVSEGLLKVVGTRRHRNGETVEYAMSLEAISALPEVGSAPSHSGTRPRAGLVPDRDPSRSGTPPVPQRDPYPSRSGTQTVLEPSLKDDDDDAGAREPSPVDNFSSDRGRENPTLRERILAACGADPVSGLIGPNGGTLGTQADMFEVGRWQADLGLDGAAILAVITDTMARKRDGPPRRLSYFTRPMQEEAARRAAPPLQPIQQEFESHARGSQEIYAPGERIPGDRRYGSGSDYRGGSAAHRALYEGFARFAAQVEAGGDDD